MITGGQLQVSGVIRHVLPGEGARGNKRSLLGIHSVLAGCIEGWLAAWWNAPPYTVLLVTSSQGPVFELASEDVDKHAKNECSCSQAFKNPPLRNAVATGYRRHTEYQITRPTAAQDMQRQIRLNVSPGGSRIMHGELPAVGCIASPEGHASFLGSALASAQVRWSVVCRLERRGSEADPPGQMQVAQIF